MFPLRFNDVPHMCLLICIPLLKIHCLTSSIFNIYTASIVTTDRWGDTDDSLPFVLLPGDHSPLDEGWKSPWVDNATVTFITIALQSMNLFSKACI